MPYKDPAYDPDPKHIWINLCILCDCTEDNCVCSSPELTVVGGVLCPYCYQELTDLEWSEHDTHSCNVVD